MEDQTLTLEIVSIAISIIAICISVYNFLDSKFRFNIELAMGKQCKLALGHIDQGRRQPLLLMSVAFTNTGGRTGYLNDVKLNVKIVSNAKEYFSGEFEALREYDSLVKEFDAIKQSEILPLVIVGRTTVVKKYVFFPSSLISQESIPESFDLEIVVFTKEDNSWRAQKKYEVKNISNVWQDLESTSNWRYSTKDVFEIGRYRPSILSKLQAFFKKVN